MTEQRGWQDELSGGAYGTLRISDEEIDEDSAQLLAQSAGRQLFYLDCQDVGDAQDLIRCFCRSFDLDLDEIEDWEELEDGLKDFASELADDAVVVWEQWELLAEQDEEAVATAVDVLRTVAISATDDDESWLVLIAGEGPSFGLPWASAGIPPWEKPNPVIPDQGELPDLVDDDQGDLEIAETW